MALLISNCCIYNNFDGQRKSAAKGLNPCLSHSGGHNLYKVAIISQISGV